MRHLRVAIAPLGLSFLCSGPPVRHLAGLIHAMAEDTGPGARLIVPTTGPLAGKPVYSNSFALLIGINEYPNLPRRDWLNYAVNDVTELQEVLVGHYGFVVDPKAKSQPANEGRWQTRLSEADRRNLS